MEREAVARPTKTKSLANEKLRNFGASLAYEPPLSLSLPRPLTYFLQSIFKEHFSADCAEGGFGFMVLLAWIFRGLRTDFFLRIRFRLYQGKLRVA